MIAEKIISKRARKQRAADIIFWRAKIARAGAELHAEERFLPSGFLFGRSPFFNSSTLPVIQFNKQPFRNPIYPYAVRSASSKKKESRSIRTTKYRTVHFLPRNATFYLFVFLFPDGCCYTPSLSSLSLRVYVRPYGGG